MIIKSKIAKRSENDMEQYYAYLEQARAALLAEAERLRPDRLDESNFLKVKANIYEICDTITKVHMNRPGGGPDACRAQLERFKREWTAAKEKAAAHNDTEKAVIEALKLEALSDAATKLEEVLQ